MRCIDVHTEHIHSCAHQHQFDSLLKLLYPGPVVNANSLGRGCILCLPTCTSNNDIGGDDHIIQRLFEDAKFTQMQGDLELDNTLFATSRPIVTMNSLKTNEIGLMPDLPSLAAAPSGSSDEVVVSGGFQQYLIKNKDKLRVETEQPRKGSGSSSTTFHDLADSLQLHIFCYLDAVDLCRISTVCRHWLMLESDDLLWKHLLGCHVIAWHVIGHSSNPMMYEECQSDWSYKDIYMRCSPEINRITRRQNVNFHQLSAVLRSLWPKKTPRFAMFGPGLETQTSGLTRKILDTKTGIFEVTGMFPGQFGGVGSGFTIKIISCGLNFNLVTLYMSTAHERQHLPREERLANNRLLVARPTNGDVIQGVEPHYELQQFVRNLCRTLDGLVFVVDASQSKEAIASSRPELMAMVSELWSRPEVPVVVLSCVREYNIKRLPCIAIVESLQLGKLNRPWQVHDCVVESLAGVQQAIQWLVEQTNRR